MVEVYCKLVIAKRRTFNQVPDKLKDQVEARLSDLGYDTNGDRVAAEE